MFVAAPNINDDENYSGVSKPGAGKAASYFEEVNSRVAPI
jgi:hypothetical protein